MGFVRAIRWLAFSSLVAAEAQSVATTQSASASPSFAYVADDGCIQNDVLVFANQTTTDTAKTPGPILEVTYSRHRYDYCQDSDLGTDAGTSSHPMFSGDLNRALLSVTILGHTASGSPVTVAFALVWEGKGGITSRTDRPQNARAGAAKTIRIENLSRGAAVSGTMDERDISDAIVGASLHTTRKTSSR